MRLGFVIFFLIFFTVYGSAQWPLYHLIVRVFSLASPWTHVLKVFFAFSSLLFLIVRVTPLNAKTLAWWADVWFGLVFIALTFWCIQLIPASIWRAQARLFDAAALTATVLAVLVSLVHGALLPFVKPMVLRIPDAPPMTVVQLSDIHLNRWSSIPRLEAIVGRALAGRPDLIVITGDLTDERDGNLDFLVPTLLKLKSPMGVYAIPGNHEFYTGIGRAAQIMEKAGIRLLRNEWLDLPNGWVLAGMDDPAAREMGLPAPKPRDFLASLPKGKPILFLNHRPLNWSDARAAGVNLQLSGHLHAGQIPPMDAIVFLGFGYPFGLYKEGDAFLYTTSGTGYWGPPMRLFVGAEIPFFKIN